ncbi:MAG: PAS domain S-box protein [Chthoniobacter sp.]|uniref:PAS domain S-box protein n=1 Tax=Chthoniobacter sp. TaxID=2510640 RepID=UPI0032A3EDD5
MPAFDGPPPGQLTPPGAEGRPAAIIAAATDGIITIDAEGRIVELNPAAERVFGHALAEARGRQLAELIAPPRHRPELSAELSRLLTGGESPLPGRRMEIEGVRAHGAEFPLEVTIARLTTPGVPFFTAFLRDLSERVSTEAALRASEASYRAIFDASNDFIFIHEIGTGATLDVNRKACETLGYSVEEFRRLGVEALIGAGGNSTPEAALERLTLAAAGQPQVFEWRNRSRSGQLVWNEVSLQRATIGGVDRLIATARDVTERKREEDRLRERTNRVVRFQTALMEMAKAEHLDLDSALRRVTEKDARTLGVERVSIWFFDADHTAIVCRDLYEVSPNRHSADVRLEAVAFPRYFEALATQRTIAATDAGHHPATSEFREVYLNPLGIVSMLDVPIWRHGKMIGVICHEHIGSERTWAAEEQDFAASIADVVTLALEASDRREAQAEVARAQALLEQRVEERTAELAQANEILREKHVEVERANRAKSEFLSRMSHELRTPMNSILGFGQVLARKVAPGEAKHVQHILEAGRHLLELINEVLDISRIESDQLRLSSEPVALGSVIQESMNLVQHLAAEREVTIGEDPFESDAFVMADRQRLKQVLVNLLSNGVKYNRRGGKVTITCFRVEDRAQISVSDTGRGIPAHLLDRLFNPFDRLGAENSEIEGTGLGLALSQRLVEHMGGSLRVASKEGVGTDFWIELPLAVDPRESLRARRAGTADVGSTLDDGVRSTVLYIEDNAANLALVETVLAEIPNLKLIAESRGETGIAHALEILPNLILLDMHLPGDQVLRRLKGDPRTTGIPIIIVSADATESHIKTVLAAGARHYLTKPLDVDRFLTVVQDALRPGKS